MSQCGHEPLGMRIEGVGDSHFSQSNDNVLALARAYSVFPTSCVGINLGKKPRGLRHPWFFPLVDPSTLGRKTLYELASLVHCYNTPKYLVTGQRHS